MSAVRKYSVIDIEQVVALARASGDLPEDELGGMDRLVELLRVLENVSDDEISRIVRDQCRRTTD